MIEKRQLRALALVAIMLFAAGCTVWGTDGPADEDDPDPDGADDLEEASAAADESESPDPDDGDEVDEAVDESDSDESVSDTDESDETEDENDEQSSADGSDAESDDDSSEDDADAENGDTDSDENEGDVGAGDDTDGDAGDGDENDEESDHTLTVEVVDEETGEPVEEYVDLNDGEEFLGEQSGSEVAWSGLDDGEYEIHAYNGTAGWTHTEPVAIDGDDEHVVVEVDPESDIPENDTYSLTVDPVDMVTGEDVAAHYTLEQDGETVETVEEPGMSSEAHFDGLENGEYDLIVYEEHGDWFGGDEIVIDGSDEHVEPDVDRMFIYWASVLAEVEDESGEPVENETVEFTMGDRGMTVETDENGEALYDPEVSYTEAVEVEIEVNGQTEIVQYDWESYDPGGDPETVTFVVSEEPNGDADGETDDNDALLALA